MWSHQQCLFSTSGTYLGLLITNAAIFTLLQAFITSFLDSWQFLPSTFAPMPWILNIEARVIVQNSESDRVISLCKNLQ